MVLFLYDNGVRHERVKLKDIQDSRALLFHLAQDESKKFSHFRISK